MSLFIIEQELKFLLENLDAENDSQTTPRIRELNDALLEKTDQVAQFRESLIQFGEYLNQKIDELEERKKFYDKKLERFDQYIQDCMSMQERNEFQGKLYRVTKRKPVQVVEIYDESLIPIEFIKIPEPKPTVMKSEIVKALKQGEIIDGARLVDGKTSIQVKLK